MAGETSFSASERREKAAADRADASPPPENSREGESPSPQDDPSARNQTDRESAWANLDDERTQDRQSSTSDQSREAPRDDADKSATDRSASDRTPHHSDDDRQARYQDSESERTHDAATDHDRVTAEGHDDTRSRGASADSSEDRQQQGGGSSETSPERRPLTGGVSTSEEVDAPSDQAREASRDDADRSATESSASDRAPHQSDDDRQARYADGERTQDRDHMAAEEHDDTRSRAASPDAPENRQQQGGGSSETGPERRPLVGGISYDEEVNTPPDQAREVSRDDADRSATDRSASDRVPRHSDDDRQARYAESERTQDARIDRDHTAAEEQDDTRSRAASPDAPESRQQQGGGSSETGPERRPLTSGVSYDEEIDSQTGEPASQERNGGGSDSPGRPEHAADAAVAGQDQSTELSHDRPAADTDESSRPASDQAREDAERHNIDAETRTHEDREAAWRQLDEQFDASQRGNGDTPSFLRSGMTTDASTDAQPAVPTQAAVERETAANAFDRPAASATGHDFSGVADSTQPPTGPQDATTPGPDSALTPSEAASLAAASRFSPRDEFSAVDQRTDPFATDQPVPPLAPGELPQPTVNDAGGRPDRAEVTDDRPHQAAGHEGHRDRQPHLAGHRTAAHHQPAHAAHPPAATHQSKEERLHEMLEGHISPEHMSIIGLSTHWEAGSNPGSHSGGEGDPGGVSYGLFQLSSTRGTAQEFIKSKEASAWKDEFAHKTPGTKEFNDAWEKVARDHQGEFAAAQTDFALRKYYQPLADDLKKQGWDEAQHSDAAKQVIFSTGIQHGVGGASSILHQALAETKKASGGKIDTDHEDVFIQKTFDERFRKDKNGVMVHFHDAWKDHRQRAGLDNRAAGEPKDALRRLRTEPRYRGVAAPRAGTK